VSRERVSKERSGIPKLKIVKKTVETAREEVAVINYHSSFSSVNLEQEI